MHVQRSHPRFRYDAPLLYRRLEPEKAGRLQNISEGGMMVSLPELFPPGTALDLTVSLDDRCIRAQAEVVWSEEVDDTVGPSFRHGLKFTRLELQDRLSLELFIAQAFKA